jgi:hypothetical protein
MLVTGDFPSQKYDTPCYLHCLSGSLIVFLATLRVAGSLAKSTDVMKSMQALIKIPELMATMQAMSKEMMKVSISPFTPFHVVESLCFDAIHSVIILYPSAGEESKYIKSFWGRFHKFL